MKNILLLTLTAASMTLASCQRSSRNAAEIGAPAPAPAPGPAQPNEPAPENPAEPQAEKKDLAGLEVSAFRIVSLKKFNQIKAGKDNRTKFYATNGKIVKDSETPKILNNRGVVCFARVAKLTAHQGVPLTITHVLLQQAEREKSMHIAAVASMVSENEMIGISCLKKNSPVKGTEFARALKGIVELL